MQPLILERIPPDGSAGPVSWMHTKALYRLTDESKARLKGCTDGMCSTSHMPRPSSEAGGRISADAPRDMA